MSNNNWGGHRPGSGRPPLEDKRKPRSIKMSDAEWSKIQELAQKNKMNTSEYIRFKALKTF